MSAISCCATRLPIVPPSGDTPPVIHVHGCIYINQDTDQVKCDAIASEKNAETGGRKEKKTQLIVQLYVEARRAPAACAAAACCCIELRRASDERTSSASSVIVDTTPPKNLSIATTCGAGDSISEPAPCFVASADSDRTLLSSSV